MKFASTMTLGLALALGGSMVAGITPAVAKKKEEAPKVTPLKLSEAVNKALIPIAGALAKGDIALAEAAVEQGRAAAKTDDEKFAVTQMQLQVALKSKDTAKQAVAIDAMIASGRLSPEDQPKFYFYQGQFAYQGKDYAKAETALANAIRTGSNEPSAYVLLADSQNRAGKAAEAISTIRAGIAAQKASGQAVPNEWYARGVDMAQRAGLKSEFVAMSADWLSAYPVKQYWHDVLFIYRQLQTLPPEVDLDLLRLARATGALALTGQGAYNDYALATYLKYPYEAVGVLKEGIAAGRVDTASSRNAKEILALSEPKIAADRASLPIAFATANGPKATLKGTIGIADAYYGYGEYAKAASLYRLALAKPGADASAINLRLGASLASAGDKEAARAAFAAVTGASQPLATYWTVWLDHPAQ